MQLNLSLNPFYNVRSIPTEEEIEQQTKGRRKSQSLLQRQVYSNLYCCP